MKRKHITAFAAAWTLIVVAVVAVWCSLALAGTNAPSKLVTQNEYEMIERYRRLEQVRSSLASEYYIPLDDDALMLGAIRGMLDVADDPYTFYYTADEMKRSNESSEGVYHGVGMVVQMTDEGEIEIVQVYEDTPAKEAGLMAGDIIVKVDGSPVNAEDQQAFTEAVSRIQGADGTSVTLTIRRDGILLDIPVTRAELNITHVYTATLTGNVGYVAITQFTGDDVEGFQAALDAFRAQNVAGIIVDLRNNPGGYLDHVVKICDMVLPEGLVTYVEDRHGNRTEEYSTANYWDVPMVVLVNENSASASELFTAAVQDYGRGKIVGTTTFGKGIVQTLITYPEDGAGMQLTTASYYSTKGRSIHLTGVTPDVVVELDEDAVVSVYTPDVAKDNQLAAALKALVR